MPFKLVIEFQEDFEEVKNLRAKTWADAKKESAQILDSCSEEYPNRAYVIEYVKEEEVPVPLPDDDDEDDE